MADLKLICKGLLLVRGWNWELGCWVQTQNWVWCLQVSGVNFSSESHWICMWLSVRSQVSHEPCTRTFRMSSNFCTIPPASESLPSLWYLSKLPLLTPLLLFPDLAWLPLYFMITLSMLWSTEATRSFPQSEYLPFMENKGKLRIYFCDPSAKPDFWYFIPLFELNQDVAERQA